MRLTDPKATSTDVDTAAKRSTGCVDAQTSRHDAQPSPKNGSAFISDQMAQTKVLPVFLLNAASDSQSINTSLVSQSSWNEVHTPHSTFIINQHVKAKNNDFATLFLDRTFPAHTPLSTPNINQHLKAKNNGSRELPYNGLLPGAAISRVRPKMTFNARVTMHVEGDTAEWIQWAKTHSSGTMDRELLPKLRPIVPGSPNLAKQGPYYDKAAKTSLSTGRLHLNIPRYGGAVQSGVWVSKHHFLTVSHWTGIVTGNEELLLGSSEQKKSIDGYLRKTNYPVAHVDMANDLRIPQWSKLENDQLFAVYLIYVDHEADIAIFRMSNLAIPVQHWVNINQLKSVDSLNPRDLIWAAGYCGAKDDDKFQKLLQEYGKSFNAVYSQREKDLACKIGNPDFETIFQPDHRAICTGLIGNQIPGGTIQFPCCEMTISGFGGLSGSPIGHCAGDDTSVYGLLKGEDRAADRPFNIMIGFTQQAIDTIRAQLQLNES